MNQRRLILVAIAASALLLLVLTASGALAQSSPSGITVPYTSRLTDPAGQPVTDGHYDFVFTLYASEKGDQALWSEMQSGLDIRSGNLDVVLGRSVSLPKDVADRKELWLSVSVRGPQDRDFTLLNSRHNLTAPSAVSALTCPHAHFYDYWNGTNAGYGLDVDNGGTGDGIRAYSNSTTTNYAAIWAVNMAGTGYGTAVYGSSSKGLGVYAHSGAGDGLEATSDTTWASAIYAHATNGNGVWAVSGYKDGVYAGTGSTNTNASALYAYSSGNGSPAGYGGYIEAAHSAGGWVKTKDTPSWIGLGVNGTLRILNGNCEGCALVYSGQNDGSADIEQGDLVAVAGVKADPDTQQPVLLIRRATSADDTVIGVAVGTAASPSEIDRSGPATAGKSGVGVAAAGEYIRVMISGLAQMKVSGKVAIGNRLVPGRGGAVPAENASNSVARVMSQPDKNGLVWVMVNGR